MDDLDATIAKRTARNPAFPAMVEAARQRQPDEHLSPELLTADGDTITLIPTQALGVPLIEFSLSFGRKIITTRMTHEEAQQLIEGLQALMARQKDAPCLLGTRGGKPSPSPSGAE